jgi:adenine-specific DNA methylase
MREAYANGIVLYREVAVAKPHPDSTKLRGGYYTPPEIAEWLVRWAIRSGNDRILEPSCGSGSFLSAAVAEFDRHNSRRSCGTPRLLGIEIEAGEASKARRCVGAYGEVLSQDFFDWVWDKESPAFDAVVGNPPFIRYQNFPEPARSKAMHLMESIGLQPNRLTNIWVPFVVLGIRQLYPGGRLAMVLPAELMQVTYAAQLRQFLTDSFECVTVFACNEMFFEDAEQEVVLLLAENKLPVPDPENRCRMTVIGAGSVAELLSLDPATARDGDEPKLVKHASEKWLKYFLSAREIEFMRHLREQRLIAPLSAHATVDVGIVTGKNEFFVMSRAEVQRFGLSEFVIPLVGRSSHLKGTVLRKADYRELQNNGQRVFLLDLNEHLPHKFPPGLRTLIAQGEANGSHRGYKCRIRDPWYNVPAIWEPDCFMFRQIYDFPRVVVNRAKATSTDTIHRMRCKSSAARVAANLYTHLTAASAEIEGRSYGGGVLELEPTEAERILTPRKLNGAMPIAEADRLVRQGRLAEVLEHNDRAVLCESLGLDKGDCSLLRGIWLKMRNRRTTRSRR